MVTGPGSRDSVKQDVNGENCPICIPADVVSLTDATWSDKPTTAITKCMVEATQQSMPLARLTNENYIIRSSKSHQRQRTKTYIQSQIEIAISKHNC